MRQSSTLESEKPSEETDILDEYRDRNLPFIYAFGIATNEQGSMLTGWRHLSRYVLCFALPDEAWTTLEFAPDVSRARLTVVHWDMLRRDYEGVVYVRAGRRGQLYRFDASYAVPTKQEQTTARTAIRALCPSDLRQELDLLLLRSADLSSDSGKRKTASTPKPNAKKQPALAGGN